MSSQTRMVNAFGTRMTVEALVKFIQAHNELSVTGVADVLNLPQRDLRAFAFAGVEMDSRAASRLGNHIRMKFGDLKIPRHI